MLDWELSTIGHPFGDLSYNCMAWHIEPGLFRGIDGLDLAALSIPSEDLYSLGSVDTYHNHSAMAATVTTER